MSLRRRVGISIKRFSYLLIPVRRHAPVSAFEWKLMHFSGDYEDRRNREKIDCSKTIWILATNALDSTIKDFCAQNHDAVFISEDEVKRMQMMKQLSKSIKQEFLHIFDVCNPFENGHTIQYQSCETYLSRK
jgi:hypothetical protein